MKKKCSVLMPFDEKYYEVYTEIYKPVCEDNDIKCWRVDEITRPGSITKDIVEGIIDVSLLQISLQRILMYFMNLVLTILRAIKQ